MLRTFMLATATVAGLGSLTHAAIYSQDFEVDQTSNWTLNGGPSDEAADFFFDYSSVGIPAAPSGAGTRGIKLQANQSSGIFGGASASPNGLVLPSGHAKVSFDWWANVNGPFPVGGSGSTQMSTFGVLTSGTNVQWPGGAQSSVWFAATGDGNSASDYRAYSSGPGATSYTAASGVYAAGTGTSPDARNQSHPYYASFGDVAAPAAQTALFPQQTGNTLVGAAGMEWHQVVLEYDATNVTWTVDGILIATVPLAGLTTSGTNIFFGHSDTNATSSTDPNDTALLFTLIDNVVVTPEPASLSALALGGVLLGRRRK